jgi:hypothetical protein
MYYSFTCILFLASLVPHVSGLVGPGSAASIPGGALALDSDPGDGRDWGFDGGRTFTFTINDHNQTKELYYEMAFANIAFDGFLTEDDETLNVCTTPVSGNDHQAQCLGETRICLSASGGSCVSYEGPILTRLLFTVSGTDAELTIVDGLPRVNTKGAGPGPEVAEFTVNLLFQAYDLVWMPALEFFNLFETPPEVEGQAHTGYSAGFYWDPVVHMSVDQHHFEVMELLVPIDAITKPMATAIDELNGTASDIEGKVDNIILAIGALGGDACESLEAPIDMLQDTLNCLFLEQDCDCQGDCDHLATLPKLKKILESLESNMELDIIQTSRLSGRGKNFFILSKVGGKPTPVNITGIFGLDDTGNSVEVLGFDPVIVFTVDPIAPEQTGGVLQHLHVQLPGSTKIMVLMAGSLEPEAEAIVMIEV